MTKLTDWAAEYAATGVVRINLTFGLVMEPALLDVEVTIVDPEDDPEAWAVARAAFRVLGRASEVYAVAVGQSGTVYAC